MARLTPQLRSLLNTVQEVLAEARALSEHATPQQRKEKFDELASACMRLHDELEREGIAVTHSRIMIQNRGVQPSDPEFYRHMHSAEDLVAITLRHQ